MLLFSRGLATRCKLQVLLESTYKQLQQVNIFLEDAFFYRGSTGNTELRTSIKSSKLSLGAHNKNNCTPIRTDRHCCQRRPITHHLPRLSTSKQQLQQYRAKQLGSGLPDCQCTAAAAVLLYMPTSIFICRFPHISYRPHLHGEVCAKVLGCSWPQQMPIPSC